MRKVNYYSFDYREEGNEKIGCIGCLGEASAAAFKKEAKERGWEILKTEKEEMTFNN